MVHESSNMQKLIKKSVMNDTRPTVTRYLVKLWVASFNQHI